MIKRMLILSIALATCQTCLGQEETVEEFIISVTSNYKNPMAYYPLRQDIFLPSEEELKRTERNNDNPENASVIGSFIFLSKDAELKRDRFITASGDLMFTDTFYRGLSKRSSYAYHRRRHKIIMNKNSNVGKFLWYNQQFKNLR